MSFQILADRFPADFEVSGSSASQQTNSQLVTNPS